MSRIYDNWERLIAAVLKREEFRRLAYCESLSSASSADLSSRFTFDSEDVYSDYVEIVKEKEKRMPETQRVRFVRCSKCGQILAAMYGHPLCKCGGCGAVIQAKKTKGADSDTFSVKLYEKGYRATKPNQTIPRRGRISSYRVPRY